MINPTLDFSLLATPTQYNGELLTYIEQHLTLNPQQLQACMAPRTQAVQVLAGAGTGKTMLITARTLKLMDELLRAGVAAPEHRLLILTFTEKAAGEMKHRIQSHLAKAGYRGVLPEGSIATFHSFCNMVLQRHSAEATHLPSTISLADTLQQQTVFEQVLKRIQQGLTNNIRSTLEAFELHPTMDEGELTNEFPTVPIDILSLTTFEGLPIEKLDAYLASFPVIISRIKAYGWQPAEFRQQARQQTIAFTQCLKQLPLVQGGEPIPAVDVLLQEWAKHLKPYASPFWFQQFSGYTEEYKVVRDNFGEPLWKALKDLYYVGGTGGTRGNKLKVVTPFDATFLAEVCALELTIIDQIAAVYALYQQALRRKDWLDFDDLINETIVLLVKNPALQQRYQQWFEGILVDEFQDTNGSQLRLLQLLMRTPPVYESPNIMVVGDAKQSIYGFRFAQKENLNLIFEGLPTEHILKLSLVQNYRSVPAVIACSNQVALNLAESPQERLQEQPLVAVQSSKHKGDDDVAVYWATLGKTNPETDKLDSLGLCQNRAEEAIAVEVLRQVVEQGRALADCCVLVRSKLEGKRVAMALQSAGIPYLLGVDALFFTQSVVQITVATLRLLHNATDILAWTQLLQPVLSAKGLATVLKEIRETSQVVVATSKTTTLQWDTLVAQYPIYLRPLAVLSTKGMLPEALSPEEATVVQQLATCLLQATVQLQQADALTIVLQTAERMISAIDILQSLRGESSKQPPKHQTNIYFKQCAYWLETLWQLLPTKAKQLPLLWQKIQQSQNDPQFKLPVLPDGLVDIQAVRIMTIHSAKGLEFPLVFVYWMRSKRLRPDQSTILFDPQFTGYGGFGLITKACTTQPLVKASFYNSIWQKHRTDFEEQRLFYVALTRAKEQLWVFRHATSAEWTRFPLSLQQVGDACLALEETEEQHQAWLFNRFQSEEVPKRAWQQVLAQRLALSGIQEVDTQPFLPEEDLTLFNSGANALLPSMLKETLTQKPLNITFSSLEKLSQCVTWYWRSTVMKQPIWQEVIESSTAEMLPSVLDVGQLAAKQGSLIHRLIETYYRLGALSCDTQQAYQTVVEQTLANVPFPQQQALQAVAFSWLQKFDASAYGWEALRNQGWQVMAPEQRLQFILPVTLQGEGQLFSVTGQVDALFYHPETKTYRLVDFKTNQTLKPAKKALYFEQLALYVQGLQANNPTMYLPLHQVALVHLSSESNQIETYTLAETPQTQQNWLHAQLAQVVSVHQQLEQTPPPQVGTPPCQYCPYALQGCEYRCP
jgi:ATP-dependent exoDNAse (exonuclease V) beta subunit